MSPTARGTARRAIRRCAVAAACGTVVLGTACGPAAPLPAAPPTSAVAPTTAAVPIRPGGVTTAADLIGPDCARLRADGAPDPFGVAARQPVTRAIGDFAQLSSLRAAIGSVDGLATGLDAARGLTVFAPSDAAFAAAQASMGAPASAALRTDQNAMGNLLAYEVLPQRYDAAALVAAKSVGTLAGGALTIGGMAAAPTVTDGRGVTATVRCGNIPTANATVFVIDKVLARKG